jgi:hypothetical protein
MIDHIVLGTSHMRKGSAERLGDLRMKSVTSTGIRATGYDSDAVRDIYITTKFKDQVEKLITDLSRKTEKELRQDGLV